MGVTVMAVALNYTTKSSLFRGLKSSDDKKRDVAFKVLKKHVTSIDVSSFIDELKPTDWAAKIGACRLLQVIGDDISISKLKELLVDNNPTVREYAGKCLEKLGVDAVYSDDEVAELVSYLSHPSWWVRAKAVEGLEAAGDVRAIEPVSRLLLDEDDTVRDAARTALEKLSRIRLSKKAT